MDSNTTSTYLKLAVVILNERFAEADYKLDRPLCIEDFDRLSSDLMLKIVVSLLKELIGDKPTMKITPLVDFNKFGVGEITFDSGIDTIYHAVKKIFPEDDELFHYSVLLLPSRDVKRTKAVITYIMMFFWVCDNIFEKFDNCFNDILKADEDKVALCTEIDEFKSKINSAIQQKENAKDRFPLLQKEIQAIEDKIQRENNKLAKLNEGVLKKKHAHESEENKITQLRLQIDHLKIEKLRFENLIVPNPHEIMTHNTSLKKQLDSESRMREARGAELNVITKRGDVLDSVIDRANDNIHNFQNAAVVFENMKLKIVNYTKSGNANTAHAKKIEQNQILIQELDQRYCEKMEEMRLKKEMNTTRRQDVFLQLRATEKQNSEVKVAVKNQNKLAMELGGKINAASDNIEASKTKIRSNSEALKFSLPQRRRNSTIKYQECLQKIADELCHFPIPKGKE